jgi:hypothetical protein
MAFQINMGEVEGAGSNLVLRAALPIAVHV